MPRNSVLRKVVPRCTMKIIQKGMQVSNTSSVKVIEKFGGTAAMHRALIAAGIKISHQAVSQWKVNGIPDSEFKRNRIIKAAKLAGFDLTREEMGARYE